MPDPPVIHDTFVIERNFPQPPETVFAAFADPVKKRLWFAVGGSTEVEDYSMDFRIGGLERTVYRFKEGTPFPGVELTNDGAFLDIVPNQRIVTASGMALGGKRISASLVTFELRPSATGTELICTHQAAFFEGADGPAMRKAGWQKLFDNLDSVLAG